MSDVAQDVAPHLEPVRRWLIDQGLVGLALPALLEGFCQRLVALGVPLARGHMSIATLHPQLRAFGLSWIDGAMANPSTFAHGHADGAAWQQSPFRHMIDNGIVEMHRRLVGPDALRDYPVLQEFAEQGYTGWVANVYGFGWNQRTGPQDQLGLVCSWATRAPGGWTDAQRRVIAELASLFALAVKSSASQDIMRDLLATYLGRDAADRVIAGFVRRGGLRSIQASILYADLRGFTAFADRHDAHVAVAHLNECLERMGGPVIERGGEILKFMGDAMLAVFLPAAADIRSVHGTTLDAAQEILARIAELNARPWNEAMSPLQVDIALHDGELLYGNVGTAERLDFTVIGPAVNEAARMEGLCAALDVNLIVSDSFRAGAGPHASSLVSLGRHALRGVREPRELFTLHR